MKSLESNMQQDQYGFLNCACPSPAAFTVVNQPIPVDGFPDLQSVQQQLVFNWEAMPPACDPAFGGQLADADVIRAGRGEMNARALRKRVQVSDSDRDIQTP
jgi:hypothetical protein